jgi:hypothetical protein
VLACAWQVKKERDRNIELLFWLVNTYTLSSFGLIVVQAVLGLPSGVTYVQESVLLSLVSVASKGLYACESAYNCCLPCWGGPSTTDTTRRSSRCHAVILTRH